MKNSIEDLALDILILTEKIKDQDELLKEIRSILTDIYYTGYHNASKEYHEWEYENI